MNFVCQNFIIKLARIISILLLIMASIICLREAAALKKERDWFNELSNEWYLFEADYTEDIKNIDNLRQETRWAKDLSLEWERIAMDFKHEALDWKMKYKEQYTINNMGLESNAK